MSIYLTTIFLLVGTALACPPELNIELFSRTGWTDGKHLVPTVRLEDVMDQDSSRRIGQSVIVGGNSLGFLSERIIGRGQVAALTDPGNGIKYTDRNEDGFAVATQGKRLLLVVADGVGGHGGGALASKTAMEAMVKTFQEGGGKEEMVAAIPKAFDANSQVNNTAGATLAFVIIENGTAKIYHCGDAKVRVFDDQMNLLYQTKDETLAQVLVDRGTIPPEEARFHPQNHIITNGAFKDESVVRVIEKEISEIKPGFRFVLTSDGPDSLDTADVSLAIADKNPNAAIHAMRDQVADKVRDNADRYLNERGEPKFRKFDDNQAMMVFLTEAGIEF